MKDDVFICIPLLNNYNTLMYKVTINKVTVTVTGIGLLLRLKRKTMWPASVALTTLTGEQAVSQGLREHAFVQ